tara:strand:+ start:165 stop:695 length:531 start_codon:yes stop_codon:yes gene_type:complete
MAVSVTEMRIEPMVVTFGGTDLGAATDISLAMEVSTTEIKADQTGDQLLSEVMTGFNCNITMTIQEMSEANWNRIVASHTGGSHTPSGGTAVYGVGTGKLFASLEAAGAKLQMKPVGAANNNRNITLHKCYPIPESVSFSGTELSTMSVTFKAVRDTSVDVGINIMAFGDDTQDLS